MRASDQTNTSAICAANKPPAPGRLFFLFFRHLGDGMHRRDIAVRPKSADNGRGHRRNLGMPVIFVAGMDIGDVQFDHRSLECLDRVEDGDRGEGIAGRIDDDGVRALPRRLDQVDQFALVVGLVERKR
jgi:hypothetical protein